MILAANMLQWTDALFAAGMPLLLTGLLLVWVYKPEPKDKFRRIAERIPGADMGFMAWAMVEYFILGGWVKMPIPLVMAVAGVVLVALGIALQKH